MPGTKGAHDPKKVKNDDNFARQNPCFNSHSSRKQGKCIVVTPGAMWPRKKKKNYARGRGREYSPSSRIPQPHSQVPLPMTDNDEEDELQN